MAEIATLRAQLAASQEENRKLTAYVGDELYRSDYPTAASMRVALEAAQEEIATLHRQWGEQAEVNERRQEEITRLSTNLAETRVALERYYTAETTLRKENARLVRELEEMKAALWMVPLSTQTVEVQVAIQRARGGRP
jgi:chromosome segregation ATPase